MNEPRRDLELLRDFVRRGDEGAFAALVQRHIDLVYATALRKLGDGAAAEEVAQNVFTVLARKAWQFAADDSLPGWLYRSTLLEAKNWLRGELRRRRREKIAAELGTTMNCPDQQPALRALVPLLDEALLSLREKERTVLLLRYYEARSLREIGASLGIGEDAAQKRVAAALERLTGFFQQRGFKTATVASATAALQHTAAAAPAFVVSTVFQAALPAGAVAVVGSKLWLTRLASLTKMQKAALVLLVSLTPVAWHWQLAARSAKAASTGAPAEIASTPVQPERQPAMTLSTPPPAGLVQSVPVFQTSARQPSAPETEYSVQLRGLVELPDFKGALLAVHHRSLDRSNSPPFVAKRVLREGEVFEDHSVRNGTLQLELVQVAAQSSSVSLRENGNDLTYTLESSQPSTALPWTVFLPDTSVSDFVVFYAELINRSVLCHPAIKTDSLSLATTELDKAATARLFENTLRERGISTLLEGEHLALLVPTAQVDGVSAALRKIRTPSLRADETLPKGTLYLENVSIAQAMVVYGELYARKLTKFDASSARTLSFRGQTALRKDEVLHAFDILLAWQGLKVVLVGDHEFKVVPLAAKGSES